MIRPTAISSVALALAATLSRTALADDPSDLEGVLNQTVVSGASRASERSSDAPATVVTLSAEEMNRYGMRSLAEAINFLGMGFVTQDPLHAVDIGGRGVLLTADFGDHVLVLVDGHALNEAWDGTAYFEQGLGMPLELVDHIELILGPGSVLYGGNAMLGVINIVSKRARSYRGVHLVVEGGASPEQSGGAFTSFAPSNLGTTYRAAAGVGHEFQLFGTSAEVTGQVEYYQQSGPPFRWPVVVATDPAGQPGNFGPKSPPGLWGGVTRNEYGTRVPSGYARLIVGDFTLAVRAASYFRTTPYMNDFNLQDSNFDDPSSYELDRWLSADLQYRKVVSSHFSLLGRLYGDTYDYQERLTIDDPSYCTLPVKGACEQHAVGVSRWAGLELQGTYDWSGDGKLTTLVGVDARVRYVGSITNVMDGATNRFVGSLGAGQATDFPFGVYAQQRWTPVPAVHLNAGVRFDSDPRGGVHLSPRGAAVIDVWSGGALKAVYSEAFRAPNFYELNYEDPGQLANPSLRAETVRALEASVEQRFGAHHILFGVYRSWWFDMVELETLASGLTQYQNSSSIDNYGYNAAFDGHAGSFLYGGSVTGAYTRRTAPDGVLPLTVAPSVYGNARAAYALPGALPVVAIAASVVGPRLADRALDGNFPALPQVPSALGLRVTVSGPIPSVPGLSFRVAWDYSTATNVPYVAGPNQVEDPMAVARPNAILAPVNRMTGFATLRYDLSVTR